MNRRRMVVIIWHMMIEMLQHSWTILFIYYNDGRSETLSREGVDYVVVVIMLFLMFCGGEGNRGCLGKT